MEIGVYKKIDSRNDTQLNFELVTIVPAETWSDNLRDVMRLIHGKELYWIKLSQSYLKIMGYKNLTILNKKDSFLYKVLEKV